MSKREVVLYEEVERMNSYLDKVDNTMFGESYKAALAFFNSHSDEYAFFNIPKYWAPTVLKMMVKMKEKLPTLRFISIHSRDGRLFVNYTRGMINTQVAEIFVSLANREIENQIIGRVLNNHEVYSMAASLHKTSNGV